MLMSLRLSNARQHRPGRCPETYTGPANRPAALLLVSEQPGEAAAMAGVPRLSARERELVTLVAHGRTNAEIAAQLFISARAVGSHLDRIRDKTGCRRRADLTRAPRACRPGHGGARSSDPPPGLPRKGVIRSLPQAGPDALAGR
jgi:DNA-binding CsgD family transcriptional regulator